jgi:hypothetical protein
MNNMTVERPYTPPPTPTTHLTVAFDERSARRQKSKEKALAIYADFVRKTAATKTPLTSDEREQFGDAVELLGITKDDVANDEAAARSLLSLEARLHECATPEQLAKFDKDIADIFAAMKKLQDDTDSLGVMENCQREKKREKLRRNYEVDCAASRLDDAIHDWNVAKDQRSGIEQKIRRLRVDFPRLFPTAATR